MRVSYNFNIVLVQKDLLQTKMIINTFSMSIPLCSVNVFSFIIFQSTQQIQFPLWLVQHVPNLTSHHQANLEPLNISEFLLTVL
jgi:hypothetical protein